MVDRLFVEKKPGFNQRVHAVVLGYRLHFCTDGRDRRAGFGSGKLVWTLITLEGLQ